MKYKNMRDLVIKKVMEMTGAEAVEFVEESGYVKAVLVTTKTGQFSINLNGAPIANLLSDGFDWSFIKNNLCNTKDLVNSLKDWENVKSKVVPRFTSKYRRDSDEYMDSVCKVSFMDLVVTFHVEIDEEHSVTLNLPMLNQWGVSMEELGNVAFENILTDSYITGLSGLLLDLGYQADEEETAVMEQYNDHMYFLSNKKRHLGAIHMLNGTLLHNFCERLGTDGAYILPSSTHEVLLIPFNQMDALDVDVLNAMIVDVNTTLDDTEILSDHYYIYDYNSNSLSCEGYENVVLEDILTV